MRHGDTSITELIGTTIAKHVWPDGSAEYLDAIRETRVARYRMEAGGKILLHHLWSSRYMAGRLRLMTENRTEQEINLAAILNARVSPDPPSDPSDDASGLARPH